MLANTTHLYSFLTHLSAQARNRGGQLVLEMFDQPGELLPVQWTRLDTATHLTLALGTGETSQEWELRMDKSHWVKDDFTALSFGNKKGLQGRIFLQEF